MKKIFALCLPLYMGLSLSCTGQRAEENRAGARLTTFEEKQKQASARQAIDESQQESSNSARAAALDFTAAAKKATPGVVHIRSIVTREDRDPYRNIPPQLREFFNLPQGPPPPIEGAGWASSFLTTAILLQTIT